MRANNAMPAYFIIVGLIPDMAASFGASLGNTNNPPITSTPTMINGNIASIIMPPSAPPTPLPTPSAAAPTPSPIPLAAAPTASPDAFIASAFC